jgi:hypothetical protein
MRRSRPNVIHTSRFAISLLIITLLALPTVLGVGPSTPTVHAQGTAGQEWQVNPSYGVTYLGRDAAAGTDRYQATISWGATFFAIAVETMPLMPAEEAMDVLLDAFAEAYPSRRQGDIRPGDSFEFQVPVDTLVGVQWRALPGAQEFRSFHGDRLIMYTSYDSPLEYRLLRADSPGLAEMKIRRFPTPDTLDLARAMYGMDDPAFRPDFLQLVRALRINQNGTELVTVDIRRQHLDDLRQLTGNQEPAGTSDSDLDVYWIASDSVAQPVFRVDDGIRDSINFAAVPSVMRVYYYKNGVIRAYQKVEDIAFVSDRQPKNGEWADVFAEYGRANPTPQRWGLGQPEQDSGASELRELGIQVLRFTPLEEPRGNFLMNLLDTLMEFMKGGLRDFLKS